MALDVVRCENCKYMYEVHYKRHGKSPYVKRKCMNNRHGVCAEGFCDRGENGDPMIKFYGNEVGKIFFDEEAFSDYYV